MTKKAPISAVELGTLWLTYQEKTLIVAVLRYLIEKADDPESRAIMVDLLENLKKMIDRIKKIFKEEGAAIPIGFTQDDVNPDAPKLFDSGLDIMIVRIIKEISMGLYTLHVNMSYREDIVLLYKDLTAITQKCYNECTQYLLKRGLLSRPPNVTMPKDVEFVQSKNYLSGFNPFSDKRSLSTIELGYIHHGIESNNVGLQVITGFAQCAQNNDVRKYFVRGMKLAEKFIKEFDDVLTSDHIQLSHASGGIVTRSQTPPFSDKLMMNFIFFLNSFGMGSQSFGVVFGLRNDLVMKFALFGKDIFFYTEDGIKMMIKNGWFEKPPGMEDRKQLTK